MITRRNVLRAAGGSAIEAGAAAITSAATPSVDPVPGLDAVLPRGLRDAAVMV